MLFEFEMKQQTKINKQDPTFFELAIALLRQNEEKKFPSIFLLI